MEEGCGCMRGFKLRVLSLKAFTKEFISKTTFTVIPACLESFPLWESKEGRWTSQHDK